MTRRHSSENWEGGFTLVELIVVVAILPLVVGAISVALLSVFNNQTQLSNSLTSSSDEQVSSSIFVQDVQSATWITNNSLDVCAGVAGTPLLSLTPDDVANTAASPIENVISYVAVLNSGSSGTYTILRERCSGGTGSPATSTRAISHGALMPPSSPSTTVSIVPNTLNISNWTAASSANNVSLNLVEPTQTGSATTNSYTLTATPRTTQTPGQTPTGGFQPILPLELVGASCPGVQITGGSSSFKVEDGTGGPGEVGVTASQASCASQGGLVSGSGAGTFSSGSVFYGASNPLAGLTPPSFPSTAGLSAGSCSPSGSTNICTSGIYGTGTTGVYSDGTVSNATFDPTQGPDPGVVVFTVPVSAGTVTFDGSSVTSATYWFEGGLTVADHTTETFGPATYIYGTNGSTGTVLQMGNHATIAVPNGSPGLLFYVPPGTSTVNLSNGFSGTMQGALSPYLYTAIWDDSSGVLNFGQGNGGGSGYTGGGIYDPNGTVQIGGQYNLNATFFVVASFSVQTSAIVAVG